MREAASSLVPVLVAVTGQDGDAPTLLDVTVAATQEESIRPIADGAAGECKGDDGEREKISSVSLSSVRREMRCLVWCM